ncbi:MAG: nucleotide exchange factor GrpE [Candidatus Helarchaeota archaeon]
MAEEKAPEQDKPLDEENKPSEYEVVDVSFNDEPSADSQETTEITGEEVEIPIPEEWKDKPESEIALLQEIQELKTQLQQKEDTWFDKYARLQAEFENFRKRNIKEKENYINYASAELIAKILPILDSSDNMLKSLAQKLEPDDYKGIELFFQQLLGVLENEGLTPIKAEGEKFDPFVHEVLTIKETDEYPEDTVIEVFQKGYRFKDRVLRPSKVLISKKPHELKPDSEKTDQKEESEVLEKSKQEDTHEKNKKK